MSEVHGFELTTLPDSEVMLFAAHCINLLVNGVDLQPDERDSIGKIAAELNRRGTEKRYRGE